jgi:hypothetical protein
MQFNLDSLVIFKLMNGEVIICEIVSEDDQQVIIRYAIQAFESVINGDIPNVNFLRWVPFTDDPIILYRHGILAVAPPNDTVKEMYVEKLAELEAAEIDVTSIKETDFPDFRHQCRNTAFK